MPLSFILHQSCGHFDAFCIWMTKNGLHNKRWITGRTRKKMAYAFVRETVRKQVYFPGCCSICAPAGDIWATSCYQQRLPTTTFLKRGMLESWPCHVNFILFKLMISANSHKYHVSASKIKKKTKSAYAQGRRIGRIPCVWFTFWHSFSKVSSRDAKEVFLSPIAHWLGLCRGKSTYKTSVTVVTASIASN